LDQGEWQNAALQSTIGPLPLCHGLGSLMNMIDPIPLQSISAAVRGLASDSEVTERFAWWAQHAFSSERWIQFELAFRLDRELETRASVGCEKNWCDIVIYAPTTGMEWIDAARYSAAIELKWYANWWVKDSGALFRDDVRKVRDYTMPALALCLALIAWPKEAASRYQRYSWIRDAVGNRNGVQTADEVQGILQSTIPEEPDIREVVPCHPHDDFEVLSLLVLGYLNDPARALSTRGIDHLDRRAD
jgi:hypothetical protein